jgi:hypothetical protein
MNGTRRLLESPFVCIAGCQEGPNLDLQRILCSSIVPTAAAMGIKTDAKSPRHPKLQGPIDLKKKYEPNSPNVVSIALFAEMCLRTTTILLKFLSHHALRLQVTQRLKGSQVTRSISRMQPNFCGTLTASERVGEIQKHDLQAAPSWEDRFPRPCCSATAARSPAMQPGRSFAPGR